MKKLIAIICLLVPVCASAQIIEKNNVSVNVEGMSIIVMNCLDAEKLLPENSAGPDNEFLIDSAMIVISSKKAVDTLYTKAGTAFSTKTFRSRTLHFTVSKDGYETLEQDWKLTSLSPYLYIYLSKRKN